ncbi:NucA/NucB deoxyribonuclease domain-containing protein [Halalkalibacter urbisdiaboli]|uniref:NucA/NucB deoxyribonuclease domain-containing protein n=1 Tax=Halalkalibacter urbisdiaboli TaxID=1960589 RepID=UPI000B436F89|nr:NucA/NucB deoxyribonuclease domain-containing protein [Halalkalibacter urbisdiaboli]
MLNGETIYESNFDFSQHGDRAGVMYQEVNRLIGERIPTAFDPPKPESNRPIWRAAGEFLEGAGYRAVSNVTLEGWTVFYPEGDPSRHSKFYQAGAVFGDVVSALNGGLIAAGSIAGGAVITVGSGGTAAVGGVAVAAVGASYGANVSAHSTSNVFSDMQTLFSKSGNRDKGKGNLDCPECTISRSKYPESAQHIEDAIKNGQPNTLTINRGGAKSNRRDSLKGHKKVQSKDLDEYPPAMFNEGGSGASVRPISPSDNRGAGSSMGHQLRQYPDGTKIRIKIDD